MTKLTLTDLSVSKELDRAAMTTIAGGGIVLPGLPTSFINDSYKSQKVDNSGRLLGQYTSQANQANGNVGSAIMQSNNSFTFGQAGDNDFGGGYGYGEEYLVIS